MRGEMCQPSSPSYQLLRMLGSPLMGNEALQDLRESKELFFCAFRNRIGLMYLDILKGASKLNKLTSVYEDLSERERETLITAGSVSSILQDANVDHVIVKTLRPYRATSNAVDVLCLGDRRMFDRGEHALEKVSYVLTHKQAHYPFREGGRRRKRSNFVQIH